MSDESKHEPAAHHGLRHGFGAYETVSEADYAELFNDGLIVLDTSTLLNLYRYTPQARSDFLAAMKIVSQNIWIPHQVSVEFWRNRESAITDFDDASSQATAAFQKAYESQIQALNIWSKRVSLSLAHKANLEAVLKDAVQQVTTEMKQLRDVDYNTAVDTASDPVLSELDSLLQGRIGPSLSPDAHKAAILEAKRRSDERRPPGFEDSKKPEDQQAGDYLLWRQILIKADETDSTIVTFVTGDVKADWWRLDSKKNPKGPRPELYEEMRQRSGKRLRMLTPQNFLDNIRDIFDLPVQPESLADVQKVNRLSLGDMLDGIFTRNPEEKIRRALTEAYRTYLRSKDFAVIGTGGVGPGDFRASRGPGEQVYDVHIAGASKDDPDYLDGLRHLLQDTASDRINATQVVVFPWEPKLAEAIVVGQLNAIVVWRSINSFFGSEAAVSAALADQA